MAVAEKTDTIGQYYRLRDAHVAAGGIVPPAVYQLAIDGRHTEAVAWLEQLDTPDSHRDRLGPFAGEVKPLTGEALTQMRNNALAHIADELHEADAEYLGFLALRAEAKCRTDLGEQMRALVDDERTRRVFTAALTTPVSPTSALGVDFWAVRTERWEQAGKVGDPSDPEYDNFFYEGGDA
ncbi:hypothetical protein [Actinoplanes regularis]|uniref:hypothetical protein n=1 Tax=Actinoplanes regularis TaxID=52697 RepID=UPI0024A50FEB|nr:hypothetical protein [Actinoplanes regularis]GLW32242.1 hypothetical protein Areg01_51810 [Actinoplanes regularis]